MKADLSLIRTSTPLAIQVRVLAARKRRKVYQIVDEAITDYLECQRQTEIQLNKEK